MRYYDQWMRDEAGKRIGHLYPKAEVTAEMARERPDLKQYVGRKLTVIAWLWARTVKSPNPAFADVSVPLASTFMLSTKAGKEAYVEPVIEGGSYRFTVKVGKPNDAEGTKNGTKLSRGANFKCLMSDAPIASDHICSEANAGRMGERLMAVVAEGTRGRVYLAPTPGQETAARKAMPNWKPAESNQHVLTASFLQLVYRTCTLMTYLVTQPIEELIMQSMTLEQLRATADAGGVVGVTLKGQGGGFFLEIATRSGHDAILSTARSSEPRRFGNPTSALVVLRDLGIAVAQIDATEWNPDQKDMRQSRQSRAQAMREAHEAAAYNKWLAVEIQASINDTRPSIPHEEVMAEMDADLAALPSV